METHLYSVTTDKNGEALFGGLRRGITYTVKEVDGGRPAGYAGSLWEGTIEVPEEDNKDVVVEARNDPKRGSFEFTKYDMSEEYLTDYPDGKPMVGVSFTVMALSKADSITGNAVGDVVFMLYRAESGDADKSDQTWIETARTGSNGKAAFINDLYQGYYYFIYETAAPPGYTDNIKDAPVQGFFAEEDIGSYSFSFENDPNKGDFSFIKADEYGSAMADIVFTAQDTTRGGLVEAVSGEDGKVEFTALPFGVYEIKEVAPRYYRQLVFYIRIN